MIGEAPRARGISKMVTHMSNGYQDYQNGTLYAVNELTSMQPREDMGGEKLNNRNYDAVIVKGVRLRLHFLNQQEEPVWINLAVIGMDGTDPASMTDFFRNQDGAVDTRNRAFSNTMTGMEFHYTPMNPENKHILWHYRFTLSNQYEVQDDGDTPVAPTTSYNATGRNTKQITKWIYVNRKFTFDAKSSTSPTNARLYLLMWCAPYNCPSSTTIANQFRMSKHIQVYYRDVQK